MTNLIILFTALALFVGCCYSTWTDLPFLGSWSHLCWGHTDARSRTGQTGSGGSGDAPAWASETLRGQDSPKTTLKSYVKGQSWGTNTLLWWRQENNQRHRHDQELIITPRVLSQHCQQVPPHPPPHSLLTTSCAAVTMNDSSTSPPPLHHRMLNINVNVFKTRRRAGNVNEAHTKG